ncbi:RNA polymerase sigma factor [Streptacidiphilus fuscans]|uniref:RNA polymerase sigma factor n=1 Tax=Streptacidiphilus fuscans TaxID=2789292 RepID=A0A931B0U4_9ACTN|nr:RNA polymerase sigma factor [Streptacidiphilus fuscans]MBF9067087.1 RNA polymerase sigma factor [Streptacidiphilus fuscans]
MAQSNVSRAVEAVWRLESARIIGGLARILRDVDLAEEMAQEALLAALEQWPRDGVPPNPGAWLTVIAKRRAVDRLRRLERLERKQQELGQDLHDMQQALDDDAALDEREINDDVLRLMFVCCHPALSAEARVSLTLRLLGGLTTREIARACLVPEATVAQRIVRAKRTLAARGVVFELPPTGERAERLASVLECLYLVFNEGYAATSGDDWTRPDLCFEALRLGRILAELAPQDAEVHGLVALMELQASRLRARVGTGGEPIGILEQDRSRWDRLLIARGFAALLRAGQCSPGPGPYVLQAAIAACHARARLPEDTDWSQIVALYTALTGVTASPVVRLNRAVAVAMASGPAEGLVLVDELVNENALNSYHALPSVRADLLAKLGRHDEARVEFERAAALAGNAKERAILLDRAAEQDGAHGG